MISLPSITNASASTTQPIVDRDCSRVFVGTSVGVYELSAVDGTRNTKRGVLGLCGAASMALDERGDEPMLLSMADSQFAPPASTAATGGAWCGAMARASM